MESDTVGCLAIDPGTTYMGVSWMICNSDFSKVLHAEGVTLKATSGLDKRLKMIHDERLARLRKLRLALLDYLKEKNVAVGSTEGAFANQKRPGAVIPLTLAIGMYTDLMIDLYPDVYIKWISPGEVKKAVGVTNGSKDGIGNGLVLSLQEFGYKFDIAGLSEHAMDAGAVNIARIKMLRNALKENLNPR